jgi:hypothetical protein
MQRPKPRYIIDKLLIDKDKEIILKAEEKNNLSIIRDPLKNFLLTTHQKLWRPEGSG